MQKPTRHEGPEPHYDRVVSGYATFHHPQPFRCEWGGELPEFTLAYETWGTLSPARDNAVLLHTGLSASSHARSHRSNPSPGWWEEFIGPELAIDTNRFFVICSNLLGGCYGSTGPASTDPRTGRPYAADFPILTVGDMVRAQLALLDHLGIARLHASSGASLGGMQSLLLAALAPERVGRVITISAALRSHPQSIALRFVQRQAVMADSDWRGGRYYGLCFPHRGQKIAREIGTITYRSGPEWQDRFGRARTAEGAVPRLDEDFEVERYLAHQGEKFCLQYDAKLLPLHLEGDGPVRPHRREARRPADRADHVSHARDRRDLGHPVPGLAAARARRRAAQAGRRGHLRRARRALRSRHVPDRSRARRRRGQGSSRRHGLVGMCGILGVGGPRGAEWVERLLGGLAHRGPDDEGRWSSPELSLGHRRLAIIGLDAGGRQPMTSRSGESVIVFNGEIYNYLELADRLEAAGRAPDRRYDTAVLLEALELWGRDALPQLNGMFAFACIGPRRGDSCSRATASARSRSSGAPRAARTAAACSCFRRSCAASRADRAARHRPIR